jgi:hypothetical protein
MKFFPILALFVLLIASCSDEKSTEPTHTACGESVYIVEDTSGLDRHIFGLGGAEQSETCLNLWLSYGGGCGEVQFKLYCFGEYVLNDTAHKQIFISLKDDDPCESFISKSFNFDISELNKTTESRYYYLNFVNAADSLLIDKGE